MNEPDSFTSVSRRLSFAFVVVITSLLFIFGVLAIIVDSSKVSSELETRLDNALKLSTISLPTPLWNFDNSVVDDFIAALFLDRAIVYAEVVWGDQLIAKHSAERYKEIVEPDFTDTDRFIDKSSDILFEGNKVGTIRLVMSRESVKQELMLTMIKIISLIVFIIGAIFYTSLLITKKYIAQPLSKLSESAYSIAQGNLETPVDKTRDDEIGQLALHFDQMRSSIKDLFSEINSSKEQIEEYSKTLEQKVEDRTMELAQTVEELEALGEVSQVVGSSLDLDKVLGSIVRHAVLFSEADGGIVFTFDQEERTFVLKTSYGVTQGFEEELRRSHITPGDYSILGQASSRGEPVQTADLQTMPEYPLACVRHEGYRALLAVPLIDEEHLVGGLVVLRKETGTFAERGVNLLHTFAVQSILAIRNARLFEEIEEKGRQLARADKHKSEFLANMSHELRTPLNAILGYTELILDQIYGEVPEKIAEVLSRLEKNGRHLLSLINDVLDLSKIEAGRFTLSLGDYSLIELVETVLASVESLAAEKNLSLTTNLPKKLPVGRGDTQRLAQVLLNLVGNAIKFTEQGEISIEAKTDEDYFIVSVKDTGPGISEENQATVFKEFHQLDGSSTKQKGGTGLGLSIAKKIIEMHGGRIWVDSAIGAGSSFTFSIPVRVENS
jgi:signal transduction histidine kinase/HAMP domain-containing protein